MGDDDAEILLLTTRLWRFTNEVRPTHDACRQRTQRVLLERKA